MFLSAEERDSLPTSPRPLAFVLGGRNVKSEDDVVRSLHIEPLIDLRSIGNVFEPTRFCRSGLSAGIG